MLTDFQFFFTGRLIGKFATNTHTRLTALFPGLPG